jgi:membrane-associated protease RseP (regulator of RpoE activity)
MLPLAAFAAEPPKPAEPPSPPDAAALERQLVEARHKLDKAAEELAMLSKKLYVMDIEGEHSTRPMLGILVDESHKDGVSILGVTPEAGAARAGLQAGDRLVALNGVRLDTGDHPMHAFKEAMANVEPGDVVAVEFVRDDAIHTAEVTTHERGTYLKKLEMDKSWDVDVDLSGLEKMEQLKQLEQLGKLDGLEGLEVLDQLDSGDVLELKTVDGDLASYFGVDQGVVVMSAPEGSELRAGDVLLAVDGQTVTEPEQVMSALEDADANVSASVLRREQRQDVTIEPGSVVLEESGARGWRVIVKHREPDEPAGP